MTPFIHTYHARIRRPDGEVIEKDYPATCYPEAWSDCVEEFASVRGVRIQIPMLYHFLQDEVSTRVASEMEYQRYSWMRDIIPPVMALTWLDAREKFGLPFTEFQRALLDKQKELLV